MSLSCRGHKHESEVKAIKNSDEVLGWLLILPVSFGLGLLLWVFWSVWEVLNP